MRCFGLPGSVGHGTADGRVRIERSLSSARRSASGVTGFSR
jgi:hypothetical protein